MLPYYSEMAYLDNELNDIYDDIVCGDYNKVTDGLNQVRVLFDILSEGQKNSIDDFIDSMNHLKHEELKDRFCDLRGKLVDLDSLVFVYKVDNLIHELASLDDSFKDFIKDYPAELPRWNWESNIAHFGSIYNDYRVCLHNGEKHDYHAVSMAEALGHFFKENPGLSYNDVLDHMDL